MVLQTYLSLHEAGITFKGFETGKMSFLSLPINIGVCAAGKKKKASISNRQKDETVGLGDYF